MTGSQSGTDDGINVKETSTRTGYYMKKRTRQDASNNPSGVVKKIHYNPRMRYTEIYLAYAEAANEAGIVDKLQLKVGINGAEPWTEEMRLKIEELLNVNCFDIYGLCEITGPGVALECIHHKGMHIYEDYFYPEVLNPADHTPCADGETGELVFTTLVKEGMPLLRYRTKDLTSLSLIHI